LLALDTRTKDALAEIDTAQQLNPASRSILADQALIRYLNGDASGAIAQLRDMERAEPEFASPPRYLAQIAWIEGDDREWIVQTRRLANLSKDPATLDEAAAAEKGLAVGGSRAMLEALRHVQKRKFDRGQDTGFHLAETDARLGLKPEAVAALRTALTVRDFRMICLETNPAFATLRGVSGFEELMREIHKRATGAP
jgi:hypothetical protein